jgi:hypothetical protein
MHKLSHATQPAPKDVQLPPVPAKDVWRVQKGYLHRIIKESLVKMTPSHKICKIGCGGTACRHCDPSVQVGPDLETAIKGLHASWVTHSVVASSRPSDRLIEEHDIIPQLKKAGITAIFNVQQENEHAHCGDGVIDGQFSYVLRPAPFRCAHVSTGPSRLLVKTGLPASSLRVLLQR